MADKSVKKSGRPPKVVVPEDEVINEENTDVLEMSKKGEEQVSVLDLGKSWEKTFSKILALDQRSYASDNKSGIRTTITKWNKLNPFLQNERIKNLFTQSGTYSKTQLSEFLADPAHHERELRAAGWTNSASQPIYYTMLRRSCDIPKYKYYIIPPKLEKKSDYKDDAFLAEYSLVKEWLGLIDPRRNFKTMALQIKREGKQSYLLRNRIDGTGKNRKAIFAAFEKMPTDWIKITGIGQLGFTISFDMMYFLNIANNPSDFGDYIEKAWADMTNQGIIEKNAQTGLYELITEKANGYKFSYQGEEYTSILESYGPRKKDHYMFWLRLPYDICFTFGSDNSHSWCAPDTMGALRSLQELTDYGKLAGLIASTPLTAILTGEAEFIDGARAGKNESVYAPEVLEGYMTQFNQATSTNVEAWLWPAKNIKLQQLSADVNSSDILSEATQNFIETAGEGGLTIVTDKPNVAQVNVAKQLAASQQRYVTLQFENVMNFVIQHKIGMEYKWKLVIWGDIFNLENDKKFLKEVVANGNVALLPKLMSAEGMSMRDTKAVTAYIKSLGFYKDFMTYSQLKNAELGIKAQEVSNEQKAEAGQSGAGRPRISDDDIDNENTARGREKGTEGSDGRDKAD